MRYLGAVAVLVGALVLASFGVGVHEPAASGNDECYGCVEQVEHVKQCKWTETCEHAWYLHDFLGNAKHYILLILDKLDIVIDVCSNNNCNEQPAVCPEEVTCTNAQTCAPCPDCTLECPSPCGDSCPPFQDLAVGLYGLAWDCQDRGLQMQFRQSPRGWIAKCRKKVRVALPTELEDIRNELGLQQTP